MEKIKDILSFDNARIINRNFEGRASKYNREGDRNFCVVIDDPDLASRLRDDGWNIKIKPPREEGDDPLTFLSIKIKFDDEHPRLNPAVYLKSGRNMNKLDEESINILDSVDITSVDMDIRPYNYDVNGKTGISAYLLGMCVTQNVNRFEQRFAQERASEE
jgi:hypothetical protein